MPLSKDEVRHVAMLARIGLEPGDEDFYAEQLSGILGHIDRLQQLDTDDIPPTAQVVEVASRLRDDDPRPSLSQEEALANASASVDGFFRVPAIQEETSAGSRILRGFKPPYTATAVARLFEAGAVMLGVTNCDEFAMGSSTENSSYFPTRNPWDLERVPGGSSGGSAAAVAAGEAMIALGTDTGGSIRQPAALCGVVGMKPTYGRGSPYGVIGCASRLDRVRPCGRSGA